MHLRFYDSFQLPWLVPRESNRWLYDCLFRERSLLNGRRMGRMENPPSLPRLTLCNNLAVTEKARQSGGPFLRNGTKTYGAGVIFPSIVFRYLKSSLSVVMINVVSPFSTVS